MMGFAGIRIHVGIRKEIPVNSNGARLLGRNAAEGLGVFQLAVSAKSHGMWEDRGSHQAHGKPALKISRKQQRQLRIALQPVEQFGRFVRLAAQKKRPVHVHRHGKRAHMILLHGLAAIADIPDSPR